VVVQNLRKQFEYEVAAPRCSHEIIGVDDVHHVHLPPAVLTHRNLVLTHKCIAHNGVAVARSRVHIQLLFGFVQNILVEILDVLHVRHVR